MSNQNKVPHCDVEPITYTKYGFILRGTEDLVGLSISENNNQSHCGSHTFMFATLARSERFAVGSLEELYDNYIKDPQWYNSQKNRPAWGEFTPALDFEPVKIIETIEKIKITLPINCDYSNIVEQRSISRLVANSYCMTKLPYAESYVFTLLKTKPDGWRDDAVGTLGYFGSDVSKRRILGVAPVPDEYRPLVSETGMLLICSEETYIATI